MKNLQGKGLLGVLFIAAGYEYELAQKLVDEIEWAAEEKHYRITVEKLDET